MTAVRFEKLPCERGPASDSVDTGRILFTWAQCVDQPSVLDSSGAIRHRGDSIVVGGDHDGRAAAVLSFFAVDLKPAPLSPKTGTDRCESRSPIASSLYRRLGFVSRHRKVASVLLVIGLATACSAGSPSTFALNRASVDVSYTCPLGASNAPYALNAAIDVHNGTSSAVTIKSVTAVMTLVAVKGGWLEQVGDKYEAISATFAPQTVAPGSSASLTLTVQSACTNGKAPNAGASYGEYSVAFSVATSAGTHRIDSQNRHRIIAA